MSTPSTSSTKFSGIQGGSTLAEMVDLERMSESGKQGLARWLSAGRVTKGLSIDDVSRITKIPSRTIQRLESGNHEGLPAEVFVKGFVRSFARAVGLDENEALLRYSGCGASPGVAPGATPERTVTRDRETLAVPALAMISHVADLAPLTAAALGTGPSDVVNAEPMLLGAVPQSSISTSTAVEAPEDATVRVPLTAVPVRGKRHKKKKARSTTASATAQSHVGGASQPNASVAADHQAAPLLDHAEQDADASIAQGSGPVVAMPRQAVSHDSCDTVDKTAEVAPVDMTWIPSMPVASVSRVHSAAWRRPVSRHYAARVSLPSLVIDDANPELAEQEQAERRDDVAQSRRSLLPAVLFENDDRSRQGGLTLAVIILLIAATLTLSYLMRRPGAGGDGLTLHAPLAPHADVVTSDSTV